MPATAWGKIGDFDWICLIGISFQEATCALEHCRGSSKSLLGKPGCNDSIMSRPAGMEPLGPGSVCQVFHAARGLTTRNPDGIQHLSFIKVKEFRCSHGRAENTTGARGVKPPLVVRRTIQGFADPDHSLIAQNGGGDDIDATCPDLGPQGQDGDGPCPKQHEKGHSLLFRSLMADH
jgi:hypothetical protein